MQPKTILRGRRICLAVLALLLLAMAGLALYLVCSTLSDPSTSFPWYTGVVVSACCFALPTVAVALAYGIFCAKAKKLGLDRSGDD